MNKYNILQYLFYNKLCLILFYNNLFTAIAYERKLVTLAYNKEIRNIYPTVIIILCTLIVLSINLKVTSCIHSYSKITYLVRYAKIM